MFSNKKLMAFSRKADITSVISVFYSKFFFVCFVTLACGNKTLKDFLSLTWTNYACIKRLLRNRKPGPEVHFHALKLRC